MNMSEAIAFTDVTEEVLTDLVRVQRSGFVHPFWEGLPTIDIKFEMSDGTEKIMQLSKAFGRALAHNLAIACK